MFAAAADDEAASNSCFKSTQKSPLAHSNRRRKNKKSQLDDDNKIIIVIRTESWEFDRQLDRGRFFQVIFFSNFCLTYTSTGRALCIYVLTKTQRLTLMSVFVTPEFSDRISSCLWVLRPSLQISHSLSLLSLLSASIALITGIKMSPTDEKEEEEATKVSHQ